MRKKLVLTFDIAVLVAALATVPLTVLLEQGVTSPWVRVADWVIWAVFLAEYMVMLLLGPGRWTYVKRNPVNLAVVILSYPRLPDLLGLVRLIRVVRFLRLLRLTGVAVRGMVGLRATLGRRGLLYVAAMGGFLVFAGGAGLTLLEPSAVRGGLPDGIWWAIVTAATVGYGDIAPVTLWGRLIAVILMLTGVGFISTLAASITAHFVGQGENTELKELRDRTARIEKLLEELVAVRAAGDLNGNRATPRPPRLPPAAPSAAL